MAAEAGDAAAAMAAAGCWTRLWEEDPLGDAEGADRDTLVTWVQTPSGLYVDMRLPRDAPGRSLETAAAAGFSPAPTALRGNAAAGGHLPREPAGGEESKTAGAELEGDALTVRLKQKSFAGRLVATAGDTTASGRALADDAELKSLVDAAATEEAAAAGAIPLCTLTWHRAIDYQPPSGSMDVGVCASKPRAADGTTELRETGEDASYAEGWLRAAGSADGPFAALELVAEGAAGAPGGRNGYWVRTGKYFAYAVGRPTTAAAATTSGCHEACLLPAAAKGSPLDALVRDRALDAAATAEVLCTHVACAGEIEGEGATSVWRITHSTLPALVGCALVGGDDGPRCSVLHSCGDGAVAAGSEVKQVLADGFSRTWRVVELDGCELPVVAA